MGKSSINWGFSIAMVDYRILYDHPHLASLECQPVWSRIGNTRVMASRAKIYSMSKMIALVLFKFLPRCQHIWLPGPVRSHPSCDQDSIISYFCDCPLNMYIYIYIESSQTQGIIYFVWGLLINVRIRSEFVQPQNYMDMMHIYTYFICRTNPLNAWFMIHSRLCRYTQNHAKTHFQDGIAIMFYPYFSGTQGIFALCFGFLLWVTWSMGTYVATSTSPLLTLAWSPCSNQASLPHCHWHLGGEVW